MRKFTGGQEIAQIPGETLGHLIENLNATFPGIREALIDGDELTPGLAAIVDGETTVAGLLQKLQEDAEVHFLPAISGGSLTLSWSP